VHFEGAIILPGINPTCITLLFIKQSVFACVYTGRFTWW